MKRVICAIMAVLMLVGIAGCGDIASSVSGSKLVRGTWAGDTYTNEFAGLEYTLPASGWTAATEEEIAEMMGMSLDEYSDMTEWQKKVAEMATVYDMVVNAETGASVMVMFENLILTNGSSDVSSEEYLEVVKEGLAADTSYGFTFDDGFGTRTIGGHKYSTLTARVSMYEVEIVQVYCVTKIDNYVCCVLVTAFGDEEAESCFDCFA